MCKKEISAETMAENIQSGDLRDFGKLLHLCSYIPENIFEQALKLGYEKEDIYQESVVAFLRALKNFDKTRDAGFRTYASVCIKNHIASILRSGNRAKHSAMVDYIPIDELELASESQPESDWIIKESFSDMKKRIENALSELEYKVLRLYLEGNSYRSIAEKTGKTESCVSNALSRVRRKLRSEIYPEK